jgi:hypothetical protein
MQLVVTSGPMAGLPVAVALEVSQIVIVVKREIPQGLCAGRRRAKE